MYIVICDVKAQENVLSGLQKAVGEKDVVSTVQ